MIETEQLGVALTKVPVLNPQFFVGSFVMKEIWVDTGELSDGQKTLAQEAFFKLGYRWCVSGKKAIELTDKIHIVGTTEGTMLYYRTEKRTPTHTFDQLMGMAAMTQEIRIDVKNLGETQRQLVQQAFFKLGYMWASWDTKVRHYVGIHYLVADIEGKVTYTNDPGRITTATHTFKELMELAGMSKRKWDKEIRAWLDGAQLESYSTGIKDWVGQSSCSPISNPDLQWRVVMTGEDRAVEEWRRDSEEGMPRSTACFREGFRAAKALYVKGL